jgi:hypothetical protein
VAEVELVVSRGCRLPARRLESVSRGRSLVYRAKATAGPCRFVVSGSFWVSLLVLKAAGELFEEDVEHAGAQVGGRKRRTPRYGPAARIARGTVAKPPALRQGRLIGTPISMRYV